MTNSTAAGATVVAADLPETGPWFEDFEVGQVFTGPPRTFSAAVVAAFAELSGDRAALHTEHGHTERGHTGDGGPLVHGPLGIAGFFVGVLGPVAWIMGGRALKEIRSSGAHPRNEQLVVVGRILGIVSTALWVLTLLAFVAIFLDSSRTLVVAGEPGDHEGLLHGARGAGVALARHLPHHEVLLH